MSELARDTPCYLVALTERPQLIGRVVEVVAGPMFVPDDDPCAWYTVTAAWVREEFQGRDLQVPRNRLLPLGAGFSPAKRKQIRSQPAPTR